MKRVCVCIVIAALLLCLTACGGGKDVDLEGLAADLTASGAFTEDMNQYAAAPGVAQGLYRYEDGDMEQCILYCNATSGEEIFLAKTSGEDVAETMENACHDRVTNQIAWLENYAPDAVPRLENAIVLRQGNYVIFVVANDAAAAQSIVDGYVK